MLIFGLRSTSDDWPGWSMDSNPICHPSPSKKIKCSFLDYVQLLMIGWASQCAHFLITFNFWWSAGLVNGLEPHLPPLSSQKHKMLIFGLYSTSDDQPGWSIGLEPHLPPLSSQKNKMLIFGLCSTLMIGRAGRWTRTPSATSLQPKK